MDKGVHAASTPDEVARIIGADRGHRFAWWVRRVGVLLALAGAVAGVLLWRELRDRPRPSQFITLPAQRADLRATVTATGTVKALDQVEVGAEVSGIVNSVQADFNDHVTAGQVLCTIDDSRHRAAVAQARALLTARRAELASQLAGAEEARSAARRTQELVSRGIESKQALEAAVATAARAAAAVNAARAQIALARESLRSAEITLTKTTIVAPIDGVVLSRSVEPGQTVVASFATPVLFTLARDLTKMEVEADIDEADVGRVAKGQGASFTVDAYPRRQFSARVSSIRNISTIIDNVVTYRAVLSVANDELLLRPGMTATVTIVTDERTAALLVPNAALRFTPPALLNARRPNMPRIFGRSDDTDKGRRQSVNHAPKPTVWTAHDGVPVPITVKTGLTDGEWTEVVAGELRPGAELIVDAFSRGK